MNSRFFALVTPFAMGLLLTAATPITTVAEEHASEAEHCIPISRIQSTDIVDDKRILFYMRGDDVYLNELPHKCPGLKFEETIMYRSSVGQLCDMDIVTVMMDVAFGFQPGASCGLGMFQPISEDEAEEIKRAAEAD